MTWWQSSWWHGAQGCRRDEHTGPSTQHQTDHPTQIIDTNWDVRGAAHHQGFEDREPRSAAKSTHTSGALWGTGVRGANEARVQIAKTGTEREQQRPQETAPLEDEQTDLPLDWPRERERTQVNWTDWKRAAKTPRDGSFRRRADRPRAGLTQREREREREDSSQLEMKEKTLQSTHRDTSEHTTVNNNAPTGQPGRNG